MILIEKLQNISFLSSGKIDKYEYFTGEDILHSNQQQQKKYRTSQIYFFPFGKSFSETNKTIEVQEALKVLKLED